MTVRGLPRPIVEMPNGKRFPMPYIAMNNHPAHIDGSKRRTEAKLNGLCQVCGLRVEETGIAIGWIYNPTSPDKRIEVDGDAMMHPRCADLAIRCCPSLTPVSLPEGAFWPNCRLTEPPTWEPNFKFCILTFWLVNADAWRAEFRSGNRKIRHNGYVTQWFETLLGQPFVLSEIRKWIEANTKPLGKSLDKICFQC